MGSCLEYVLQDTDNIFIVQVRDLASSLSNGLNWVYSTGWGAKAPNPMWPIKQPDLQSGTPCVCDQYLGLINTNFNTGSKAK